MFSADILLSTEFLISTAAFLAVKLAGYYFAGVVLNGEYSLIRPVPAGVFGFVRMLLGLVVSGGCAFAVGRWIGDGLIIYLVLIPVRLLEWAFIIWLFFERRFDEPNPMRLVKLSAVGGIWTYVLDIPAVLFSIMLPGGFRPFMC